MTFQWVWNQRTAWRAKACGRSRPEYTRSSRDSRTGWEWKSSEWFPGGWSRQRPRCCSVPGTAANYQRRARNRTAGASLDLPHAGMTDWRASSRTRSAPIQGFGQQNEIERVYGQMTWSDFTGVIRRTAYEGRGI